MTILEKFKHCVGCEYYVAPMKRTGYIVTSASTVSPTYKYTEHYSSPMCLRLKSITTKTPKEKPKRRKKKCKDL